MLCKIAPSTNNKDIRLSRFVNGAECSRTSAFSLLQRPVFRLSVSRKYGICSCFLTILNDSTGIETGIPFVYENTELGADIYYCLVDFEKLCAQRKSGLFYFTVKLDCGTGKSFYLSSVNNIDFHVTDNLSEVQRFRLLVYSEDFYTPEWAKEAVMYHIFVDRFCKTPEVVPTRTDCKINSNWDTGIPEYAEYPGAELANNEFFGGNLYGVSAKLDYLKELGVNCIYLSPIFKAYSNHKYDTGDYMQIDEMFGGESAFDELLHHANELGIHVILDGVFNHTGDDSRYFNRYGKYDSIGAYQSKNSPYYDWYTFKNYPEEYECWWGIRILPKLNNTNPSLREFFLGENGVVDHYIKKGISGWRLDVADELPKDFLEQLRRIVKKQSAEALIIGEVWENAADKVAYGSRRFYLNGDQLDSVMNYPIKNAIIDFVKNADCTFFYNTVTEIYSSYPAPVSSVLMNILSTHDTARILTELGRNDADEMLTNREKSTYKLSREQREKAVRLLKIASVLQFTLPGMPSVFYGDEAGVEGFGDPFCRKPYPWGKEDTELVEHYKKLCHLKRSCKAFEGAHIEFLKHEGGLCAYERRFDEYVAVVMVNLTAQDHVFELCNPADTVLYGDVSYKNECVSVSAQNAAIVLCHFAESKGELQ